MFSVISHGCYRFYKRNGAAPGASSDLEKAFKDSVAVIASATPQQLPDWARADPMFGWAVSDGTIIEVVLPKAAPVLDAAEEPEEAPARGRFSKR